MSQRVRRNGSPTPAGSLGGSAVATAGGSGSRLQPMRATVPFQLKQQQQHGSPTRSNGGGGGGNNNGGCCGGASGPSGGGGSGGGILEFRRGIQDAVARSVRRELPHNTSLNPPS